MRLFTESNNLHLQIDTWMDRGVFFVTADQLSFDKRYKRDERMAFRLATIAVGNVQPMPHRNFDIGHPLTEDDVLLDPNFPYVVTGDAAGYALRSLVQFIEGNFEGRAEIIGYHLLDAAQKLYIQARDWLDSEVNDCSQLKQGLFDTPRLTIPQVLKYTDNATCPPDLPDEFK